MKTFVLIAAAMLAGCHPKPAHEKPYDNTGAGQYLAIVPLGKCSCSPTEYNNHFHGVPCNNGHVETACIDGQCKNDTRCPAVVVSDTKDQNEVHDNVVFLKYNEKDLSQATMDRMWNKVDHLESNERYPPATLKAARYKLKCFEDWANTVSDSQVKAAYLFWVGIYASSYDRIEENNKKPEGEILDPYEAERRERKKRADAIVIPKPPKAICLGTEVAR